MVCCKKEKKARITLFLEHICRIKRNWWYAPLIKACWFLLIEEVVHLNSLFLFGRTETYMLQYPAQQSLDCCVPHSQDLEDHKKPLQYWYQETFVTLRKFRKLSVTTSPLAELKHYFCASWWFFFWPRENCTTISGWDEEHLNSRTT